MAIKFPQYDLPVDPLLGRISGASALWGEDSGLLISEDFFEPSVPSVVIPAAIGVVSSSSVETTSLSQNHNLTASVTVSSSSSGSADNALA